MAGTKEGGKKARETNLERYGKDFYVNIGSKGGSKKVPKGFALMEEEKKRLISIKGGKNRWKNS